MPEANKVDGMLSAKSLAKRWDCRLGYVYQLVRAGKLNSIKFGPHMVRIPLEDIHRYEEAIWNKTTAANCSGDLDDTGGASQPSSAADLSADASASLRATKVLRSVASGS